MCFIVIELRSFVKVWSSQDTDLFVPSQNLYEKYCNSSLSKLDCTKCFHS